MTNEAFRIHARLRLFMPVLPEGLPCTTANCTATHDTHALHASACSNHTGRHAHVNAVLIRQLQRAVGAGFKVAKEPNMTKYYQPSAIINEGDGTRADILVTRRSDGQAAADLWWVDLVITTPTNTAAMNAAGAAVSEFPKDASLAAALAEKRKRDHYDTQFPGNAEVKDRLRPFGLDCYGAWGPGADAFLAEMVGEAQVNLEGRAPTRGTVEAARGRLKRQMVEAIATALAAAHAQHLLRVIANSQARLAQRAAAQQMLAAAVQAA
jgi:hypothetical protein